MLLHFLEFLGAWSVLIPAFIGLHRFKYLDKPSRIIWLMTLLACLPQMASVSPFMKGKRYALYNCYIPVEFFLSAVFLLSILKERFLTRIICVYTILFLAFYTLFLLTNDLYKRFYSKCVAVTNLMTATGILFIIFHSISRDVFKPGWKNPATHYIIGLFFYAPITVLSYTFWNFLQANEEKLENVWTIHYIANTVMYFLFATGIYKNRQIHIPNQEPSF